MNEWIEVCRIEDIVPGSGVCARIGKHQVALFRPRTDDAVFALDNIDPFFEASVLSRGLIVEHDDALWVASPLKKQLFRLSDGLCQDAPERSRASFATRVEAGRVLVHSLPSPRS
ncbi:nitrite reductase small subunit NirD [Niveibacterium terrae]|uniref:nitrite reductase small subunit NirD n=1 Tax=Niveibacterium terrae TaxID=3373598 RepID=UPI003A93555F